jgi:hypothetical protein
VVLEQERQVLEKAKINEELDVATSRSTCISAGFSVLQLGKQNNPE